jgi:hypothetical protein
MKAKIFKDREMNFRDVNMKYGREIWGLSYGLTIDIDTLKCMARIDVLCLLFAYSKALGAVSHKHRA